MITEEAAVRLGVDPSRVRQLIRAGRLPARKQGRDWWIEEADLARVQERKPGRPRRPEGSIGLRYARIADK